MSCFVNEKCGFVNSTVLSTPLDEVVVCRLLFVAIMFRESMTQYRFGIR